MPFSMSIGLSFTSASKYYRRRSWPRSERQKLFCVNAAPRIWRFLALRPTCSIHNPNDIETKAGLGDHLRVTSVAGLSDEANDVAREGRDFNYGPAETRLTVTPVGMAPVSCSHSPRPSCRRFRSRTLHKFSDGLPAAPYVAPIS